MAMSRPLTAAEAELARSWFGDSLDPRQVRLLPFLGPSGRAFVVTLLHVSYVCVGRERWGRDLAAGPPPSLPDRRLLLHELTHAWQAQHGAAPRSYMWVSLLHQARHGRGAYDVPTLDAPFTAYGPEQQGRIVERAAGGDPKALALLEGSGPRTRPPRRGGAARWVLAATPLGELVDLARAPFGLRGWYGRRGGGRRQRMLED